MKDLFQTAGVRASTRRPRPVCGYAPEPRLDRSILAPPEVQALPYFLAQGLDRREADPSVELRLVGPELARARMPKLGPMGGAKPFRDKRELLAGALHAGLLPYRGRTIVEDRSGAILDGAALLAAIAETGVTVCCHWVTGVDRHAICVMDRHRARPGAKLPQAIEAVASTPLADFDHATAHARLVHRSNHVWVTLTKPMADACLDSLRSRGIPHRRVKPSDELYRDVAAGRFLKTGQPLAIDDAGILRDGARRCHAVSLTGKSIRILVTYGLDPALPAAVFDCTAPENLGFHLQRLSHVEGWDVQGSLRILRILEGTPRPTQYDLYALYRSWPGYEEAVRRSKGYQHHLCQSVHVSVRALLSRRHSPEAADAFLSRVLTKHNDAVRVGAFREGQRAAMTRREARAADLVWERVGSRLTRLTQARRLALVELFLEAFRIYSGAPARRGTVAATREPPRPQA